MGSIVQSFIEFINEARVHYDEQPTLALHYKNDLQDFEFESELLSLIEQIEQTWINMKNQYWWNRESWYKNNHFALDVKVYIWPDQEKIKEIIGRELSDQEYENVWYTWLNDQREALVDNIDFSWVKDVSWGGKQGGWLLIAPEVTESDNQEQIEELMNVYLDEKKEVEESDEWEKYKSYLEDQDYKDMLEMGMINDPDEIAALKQSALAAIKVFKEALDDLHEMIDGLDSILKRVQNFRVKGLEWFYEYLKQEHEEGIIAAE